jgi:decaprenyl-phosphate phosphoribosyltransferase
MMAPTATDRTLAHEPRHAEVHRTAVNTVTAMTATRVALPIPAPVSPRLLHTRWMRSVRPNQWSKAALVAAAPLAAAQFRVALLGQLLVAVIVTCVAASGAYLLNDTRDAATDRLHPTKRLRPIAAGEIDRRAALIAAMALLTAAPSVAFVLSGRTTALAVAGYEVLSVGYSFATKRIPVLDVVSIAAGFVLRVLIGAAATKTVVSMWLVLAVSAGAFMVATGKRRGEVAELGAQASAHRTTLGFYRPPVTRMLLAGSAATLFASLVGWVEIGHGGPRLAEPWAGLLLIPLLLTIGRYVSLAYRGLAAAPELLIGDRRLRALAASSIVLYLIGSIFS